MAIKRIPRPRDPVQLGKLIVDIASGQVADAVDDGKDAATTEARTKGAQARAATLSPQQRTEIARRAAVSRWQKE